MRFTPQIRAIPRLVARPIAHRGLHDRGKAIVENSESAFAAAMALGYAIECDLQVTACGEVVVFHDDTLDRVMEARGAVRAHDIRALKRMSFKAGKDRIQTLGELLEQVEARVPLMIELKTHWDGDAALVTRALQLLARYRGPHGVMSFDPEQIEAVAALSPKTVRGIVADRVTHTDYRRLPFAARLELRSLSHAPWTLPHFVSYFHRDLPFEPVSRSRAEGLPVITWTIRSQGEASAALRYCDQITFEGFLP